MAIKIYKPVTPGLRHLRLVDRSALHKGAPWKSLVHGLSSKGGRNNLGRITVRRRGGGHKRSYRLIDFKRKKIDVWATVVRLEYDPNRTAFIALIKYEDDEYSYIISPDGLKVGDMVISGNQAKIKPGHANVISEIPVGTVLHNVELNPGQGGKLARAAGSHAQLIGKVDNYAQLRLSSGEQRMVQATCWATIGTVSNLDHLNVSLGKAGRSRWLGRRPKVRGVAMNPHDHPHGGGEGKSSGGRHPVTPWGVCTKGKRTRSNARTDKFIISRRKK